MVKVKNKSSSNADSLTKKKNKLQKKVLNPFEVHINKEKLAVLGRKVKNDRGLPGISRAKALAKRKHTLLPEYTLQNKANSFRDKRIGEKDRNLSIEEKSMARYTAVRVKQHSRKSIFNLADDEVLTHKGQTLSEIEKFDDPLSDVDEDVEDSGKLDRKFVEDAHFGGGMLRKADGNKSHKDLIEQLIAESKKRKAEMQKQKEATLELTEKLDSEWKDLLPLVTKRTKDDEVQVKNNVDDFDKTMRELIFAARGVPSDKLKTEDEIAKEEKERLERLERERLERMNGNIEVSAAIKHRSADDLDDNFAYDDDDVPETTLSYNDQGKSNVALELNIKNKQIVEDSKANHENDEDIEREEEGEDANESNEDDGDEEESEAETEDDLSDLKESEEESTSDEEDVKQDEIINEKIESVATKTKKQNEIQITKNQGEISMNQSETSKNHSNILKNQYETYNKQSKISNKQNKTLNSDELATKKEEKQLIETDSTENVNKIETKVENKEVQSNSIKEDLLRRKEIMEKARQELPYTFALSETYESLQATLKDHSAEHQGIIIERMIKCNHSSLKEGNKEGLAMLFVYLMQYLNDLCNDIEDEPSLNLCFKVFANLAPHIFDLTEMNPENTCNSLFEVIKEKQMDFRASKKGYPGIDVLIYLKLVSLVCSTSDFKHLVVTPCMFFMAQMLTTCAVKTRRDLAYGLFVVCLFLEYTTLSKRFLPQVIVYLNGIIYMAIPKRPVQILKALPPFKTNRSSLVINEKLPNISNKLEITDLITREIDEKFKHRVLHVAVGLLKKFYINYQQLPSSFEIFETTLHYLNLLPQDNLDDTLKNEINNFIGSLDELKDNRKLEYIVMEKRRPKALRLYEPTIQRVYDCKSHKVQSKEKAEHDKLVYKLKKETKGALREIRRDKAFLGRVKLNERLRSDAERKEKVKRIYAEASMQQSELNSLDRSNKRKKKL